LSFSRLLVRSTDAEVFVQHVRNRLIIRSQGRPSARAIASRRCLQYFDTGAQFPLTFAHSRIWHLTSLNLFFPKFVNSISFRLGPLQFLRASQLGTAFGLAICTLVNNAGKNRALEGTDQGAVAQKAAMLRGYRAAFWMCFAFAIFGESELLFFFSSTSSLGFRSVLLIKNELGPMYHCDSTVSLFSLLATHRHRRPW